MQDSRFEIQGSRGDVGEVAIAVLQVALARIDAR